MIIVLPVIMAIKAGNILEEFMGFTCGPPDNGNTLFYLRDLWSWLYCLYMDFQRETWHFSLSQNSTWTIAQVWDWKYYNHHNEVKVKGCGLGSRSWVPMGQMIFHWHLTMSPGPHSKMNYRGHLRDSFEVFRSPHSYKSYCWRQQRYD